MISIALIIPAAGLSQRHPPNKLLGLVEGERAISRTLKTFIGFPLDLYVVIGHQEKEMREILAPYEKRGVKILVNNEYSSGMASSLKTGLAAIPPETEYAGISLGDKPFIQSRTIEILLAALSRKKPLLLLPEYLGERGHPVFFRRDLFEELSSIDGEMGGREILTQYEKDVVSVPVDDEGVILDLDEYLERLDG